MEYHSVNWPHDKRMNLSVRAERPLRVSSQELLRTVARKGRATRPAAERRR